MTDKYMNSDILAEVLLLIIALYGIGYNHVIALFC